ncbi:hypothetical protein B0T25DRAFT_563714 [Lasiosphaeria hispida]|uniref:Methyltransferase domain-containing protein n=1 Tax=Lasiosphaeria hispida TaxID=260671 RepID=A0AAJ0MLE1_9PEZI|nr:hypothetical protein B0T25DRAFT_563714 [Lasiosphaeria hispida]
MPPDFEQQSYWHTRFESEQAFEWLMPSARVMEVLEPQLQDLPRSTTILQLGLGTSDLQNHLRSSGFTNITNLDFEPIAIERGRQLEHQAFGDIRMEYIVADATQLNLPSRFSLVIDKCAADAIACGGEGAVLSMARSVAKHLAPGCIWLSLSYSPSRFRIEGLPLEVEVLTKLPIPKLKPTDPDIYHYCYILRHKQPARP